MQQFPYGDIHKETAEEIVGEDIHEEIAKEIVDKDIHEVIVEEENYQEQVVEDFIDEENHRDLVEDLQEDLVADLVLDNYEDTDNLILSRFMLMEYKVEHNSIFDQDLECLIFQEERR